MKKLIATSAALVLLSAAPALAMGCCGRGKGKAGMCAEGSGSRAMNMKGKKGGWGCEGMTGGMSKRG